MHSTMRIRRKHAAAAAGGGFAAAVVVWWLRRAGPLPQKHTPEAAASLSTTAAAEPPPAPLPRECTDCGVWRDHSAYSARQWKGSLRCKACVSEAQRKLAKPESVVCPYCDHETSSPTKEHLLPKSAGGTYTIWVCGECNAARMCSGAFPAFRDYIEARPQEWAYAVRSCKAAASAKRAAWIAESGLIEFTISALE